jgi:hypothetical protein
MSMDTKFKMPASAKIKNLLKVRMEYCVVKLKDLLASSRRVTICLHGWTKKGLSASFLGISVCFFNSRTCEPQHVCLSLDLIKHPHTDIVISQCLEACPDKWGISKEKILLIVTDNGANMGRQ